MTLRVVHVNCVIDPLRREPEALLDAWFSLPQVAEATAAAGAETIVLQASHRPAQFTRRGVNYRFVPVMIGNRRRSAMFLAPGRLARAARQEQPDVIHLHGLDFPLHARALSGLGKPVLVQDHASQVSRRYMFWRRWGYARAAAVTFSATSQADPFFQSGQLSPRLPIYAVPECSSDFSPGDQAIARTETGVRGAPALLWVGRLDANKDPLTILRAAALASEALPDLQLWCAFTEQDLRPQVEDMIRHDRRLNGRVNLLGPVPHRRIETLARASDLFVLGSHREAMGYSLMEAIACGLPPIVSDIPSFAILTGGGAIGALAEPGNAKEFAAAIVRLARDPDRACRARVRNHFIEKLSFDALGARLMEVYRAIIDPRPVRR